MQFYLKISGNILTFVELLFSLKSKTEQKINLVATLRKLDLKIVKFTKVVV